MRHAASLLPHYARTSHTHKRLIKFSHTSIQSYAVTKMENEKELVATAGWNWFKVVSPVGINNYTSFLCSGALQTSLPMTGVVQQQMTRETPFKEFGIVPLQTTWCAIWSVQQFLFLMADSMGVTLSAAAAASRHAMLNLLFPTTVSRMFCNIF
ncbi:hypothetical protein CEUSTIGMA_g12403.t1 [Chlamydomonas eustigma]|uniref:Uncharacterized protein n=1 Tax=Chlamydomonas eustigma TaxID=1157962 RepID=A0A250XPX6_9CHLO|nr:hypothetical protein CEUSTIGMA_g12403.t1 [Chlamydomonas eustigma]|eukprot:GAX84982.1 hypothetical protein CEUSTIGMA_g12403.t1 [Chlamydomonas eustigma]